MQNSSKIHSSPAYSLLVVDHNRLFREKIQYLLAQYPHQPLEIESVSELGYESQQKLQNKEIDLLLCEGSVLHHEHHFAALRRIHRHSPHLRTIFFSHQNDSELDKKLAYFKATVIEKVISTESLYQLIQNTLHSPSESSGQDFPNLTQRELDILKWIVKGDSNKQIASELNISESTVKVHIQNILRKMNVSSRVEIAVFAVKNQLVL